MNEEITTIINQYEPKAEWFRKPEGIHGVGHSYRVLIHSHMIGIKEGADLKTLYLAAITHDTQRYNEGYDTKHGTRSANWVKKQFPEANAKAVSYLNRWHVPSDDQAPEMTLELKCFKDADALDRWRLPIINEGTVLNPKYLRTETAKQLIPFSKALYEDSMYQKQFYNHWRDALLATLNEPSVLGKLKL